MIFDTATTLIIIYVIWKLIQQHLRFKGIPRPFVQIPLLGGTIGHSIEVIRKSQHKVFDLHTQYGPIILAGTIGAPMILVSDPAEIKRIHSDTKLFPRSDFLQKKFAGVLDLGLATLPSGPIHRSHRKTLQPAFAPIHLRQVPDACNRVFQIVASSWGSQGTLDFDKEMLKVTLDVLGQISFGVNLGAVEGKLESTKLWSGLEDFLFTSKLGIKDRFLWNYMGVGFQSPNFIKQVGGYHAFFDALIDSPEINTKLDNYQSDSKFDLTLAERLILAFREGKLSRKELYDEFLSFVVAGHETSSHTLSFLLWDLCAHPHLQDELHETVKDIQDLNNMPSLDLLDRILKESQRLHSLVVGGIPRVTSENTIMCGYTVPKDTIVRASYRSLNFDPKYYPSPLEFKPERWLDPESSNLPFYPFSGGDHSCIGQKLALLEIKTLMVCFLQKYRFSMSKEALEAVKVTEPFTLKCDPQIEYCERN